MQCNREPSSNGRDKTSSGTALERGPQVAAGTNEVMVSFRNVHSSLPQKVSESAEVSIWGLTQPAFQLRGIQQKLS